MDQNFERLDPIGIHQDDIDINFVLVHGLDGDAIAFLNLDTGKSMMTCLRSSFPRSRIIKYIYPNNSIGMMTIKQPLPLNERGLNFVQGLSTVLHDKAPIIFIGHSMGGLVIKQALITAKETHKLRYIWDLVKGVAFYGTPHTGSSLANVLSYLRLHSIAIDELKDNNDYLLTLKRDFNGITKEKKLKILSIVETQKCGIINKKVVEYGSAVCGLSDAYEESYKLDWDHTQIQRPSSIQDERYKHLYCFITRTALKKQQVLRYNPQKPHAMHEDDDDQKEGLMDNGKIVCIDPKYDKSDDISIALRTFDHRQDLEGFTGLMAAVLSNESKNFKRKEIENAFKDDILKQNRKILNELLQTKELIDHIDTNKIKESIQLSMKYWNLLKQSKSVIRGKKDDVRQLLVTFKKFHKILKKGNALQPGEKLSDNEVQFVAYVGEEIQEWFEDNPKITDLKEKWNELHTELAEIQSFWKSAEDKIKEILAKKVAESQEKLQKAKNKLMAVEGIFGCLLVGAAAVGALIASPFAIAVAAVVAVSCVVVGAYAAYKEMKEIKKRQKAVNKAKSKVDQMINETERIIQQFDTMTTNAKDLDALFSDLVDHMQTAQKPAKKIRRHCPNYEILEMNAGIVIESLEMLQTTCNDILDTISKAQDDFYK